MKRITVSAALIRDGDRLFATQRGYGEQKDGWEFPGGKVEPGETPEAAVVREIGEELGASIAVDGKAGTVDYDYPTFHITMHCFFCHVDGGTLTLREHEAARWLGKEELFTVAWLPPDRILLENLYGKETENGL